MNQCILILDNIRSAHNVGGIIRNAVAFGVSDIYTCGITPYPKQDGDPRLPHVARSATQQIAKTALTGLEYCNFTHFPSATEAIKHCAPTHTIYALELDETAESLATATILWPAALILGNEVEGVSPEAIALADTTLSIPTTTDKRSLNVTTASGIALYQLYTHK